MYGRRSVARWGQPPAQPPGQPPAPQPIAPGAPGGPGGPAGPSGAQAPAPQPGWSRLEVGSPRAPSSVNANATKTPTSVEDMLLNTPGNVGGHTVDPNVGGGMLTDDDADDFEENPLEVGASLEGNEQALMDAIAELFNGGYDTAAQEQAILENYSHQSQLGQGQLAAQLGAGGFGQSGALAQLGSDLQGQLAGLANQDIWQVQRDAERDRLAAIAQAGQLLQGQQGLVLDAAQQNMILEMLSGLYGTGPTDAPPSDEYDAPGEDAPGVDIGSPPPGGAVLSSPSDLPHGSRLIENVPSNDPNQSWAKYEDEDGNIYYILTHTGDSGEISGTTNSGTWWEDLNLPGPMGGGN